MNVKALVDVLEDHDFSVEYAENDTELVIACPLCYSEDPKLYISVESGIFLCFRCDARGGLRSLLIDVCEMTPNEAIPLEMTLATGPKRRPGLTVQKPAPATAGVELPNTFRPLTMSDRDSPAALYLAGRGIEMPQALALGIGYCLFGWYAYRVIVPVYTRGAMRTFVARSWLKDISPKDKVLMPPGSQAERALFGYDFWGDERGIDIVLVEGVFDAINVWNAGVPRTLATLGAHVTELQRSLIKQLNPRHVILLRDRDTAGQDASIKEAKALSEAMFSVKIAHLGKGDPGSAGRAQIIMAVENAVQVTQQLGTEAMKEGTRA